MAAAGCGADPPRAVPQAAAPTSAAPAPAVTEPPAPSVTPTPQDSATAVAAGAGPPSGQYVFPVMGNAEYERTHAEYPATDIFAACGAPVRAVTDGVVVEVSRVDRFDPAHSEGSARGGLFVAIRGDDGVRYYGAHLSVVAPPMDPGLRVTAGTPVGEVGHTGNARNICHLHFAISPPCGVGDWWTRRGVVWPWRYLDAWRAGQNLSPAAEVLTWQ